MIISLKGEIKLDQLIDLEDSDIISSITYYAEEEIKKAIQARLKKDPIIQKQIMDIADRTIAKVLKKESILT